MARPRSRGGTRLRPGDVLEVCTPSAKWYLCYIGRHALLGDTVWILPQPHSASDTFECAGFNGDGYYAFYPATAATRQELVRKAAFCADGMRVMPRLLRFADPFGRRIWRIAEDVGPESDFVVRTALTVEEARLPEAAVWNHEFLLDRLRANWHPRQDAGEIKPEAG